MNLYAKLNIAVMPKAETDKLSDGEKIEADDEYYFQ
jgi:hypothetical protein